jgi:hypothetical protein
MLASPLTPAQRPTKYALSYVPQVRAVKPCVIGSRLLAKYVDAGRSEVGSAEALSANDPLSTSASGERVRFRLAQLMYRD